MSDAIVMVLEATLQQAEHGYQVTLKRLDQQPTGPSQGYRCQTTIRSFKPDLVVRVYWRNAPHNSSRLLETFRADIEACVKEIIADDPALRAAIGQQTGGLAWTL